MRSKDKYLPPSAKTIALKTKLLTWMDEAPTDKIISQCLIHLLPSTADAFRSLYPMENDG